MPPQREAPRSVPLRSTPLRGFPLPFASNLFFSELCLTSLTNEHFLKTGQACGV